MWNELKWEISLWTAISSFNEADRQNMLLIFFWSIVQYPYMTNNCVLSIFSCHLDGCKNTKENNTMHINVFDNSIPFLR